MDEREFKGRTKKIALRVVHLVESLPQTNTADIIGRQLLRCGTSIGANYRAACRGKSAADVLAKLAIVEEETDETIYWIELLIEAGILPESRLKDLVVELNEILAMTVASIKTLRAGIHCTAARQCATRRPKSKIQN
jgi:four helix bundle protein